MGQGLIQPKRFLHECLEELKRQQWCWPFTNCCSVALAVCLLGLPVLWLGLAGFGAEMHQEHGPLENLQIACLAVGSILLLVVARRQVTGAACVLVWALALLHVNFIIHEFDVRPFGIEWLVQVFRGPVRNTALALAWLTVAFLIAMHWKTFWPAFCRWLTTPSGWLMSMAGVFWVGGKVMEKGGLFASRPTRMLMEECMEVNACLLMALSASALCRAWKTGPPAVE